MLKLKKSIRNSSVFIVAIITGVFSIPQLFVVAEKSTSVVEEYTVEIPTVTPYTAKDYVVLEATVAVEEMYYESTYEPQPTPDPWTEEDVEALARTISGESYDDKPDDKRKVAEVVLNRLSNGYWGDTVLEVVTLKHQFRGYWKPGRDITENDMEVAIQALRDWYEGGCEPLSEYLYFFKGSNRENRFRKTYR